MRHFLKTFPLIAAIALTIGTLVGCEELEKIEDQLNFEASFKEAGPGYVDLNIKASAAFEVAYDIRTEPRNLTNPSILFASGTKIKITPDMETLRISADIQESTEYYVYMAAKLSAEAFSDIYEFTFKTGEFEFSNMLTVVGVDYDGYKMNITVPASVKKGHNQADKKGTTAIRYNQCDLMMYNYQTRWGDVDDYFTLLYNAGNATTENVVLEYSSDLNWDDLGLDLNGDGEINEDDLTYKWNPISPGEPVVFVAGEFEWMEEPEGWDPKKNYSVNGFDYPAGWEPGYYLPCIDHEKYWDFYGITKSMNVINPDLKTDIDGFWTGEFQRKAFRVKEPAKLDAKVNITVEDIGPVNATVILEPEEGVELYAYAIMDDTALNQMLELCDGKEEYLQWAITSFFGAYTFATGRGAGYTEIELENYFIDVPANSNIHILTTAMGDEMATTQSFNKYTFQTKEKTMDAPEVVVTVVEDETSPFMAAFNIKCTTYNDPTRGPLKKCFYGANYKKDFIHAVNKNSSYFQLGQSQQFTEAEVELINSPEGYTIKIPSIDGETTRIAVVGFNVENTPNDFNFRDILECPAVADCTTPYRDFKPYVQSDLYETLTGDWTATAKLGSKSTHVSKISLSDGIKIGRDFPAELPDSVYTIYKEEADYTEEETRGYFEEFKTIAEEYNKNRVEYQNNILMNGWIDEDEYNRLAYVSPWDMFISREYNGVDVKSMFSDFGPKLYLEVSEGDKLSISGDMYYMPPVSYYSIPYYLTGYCPDRSYSEGNIIFYDVTATDEYKPLTFPVELSNNGNTLTIKAIKDADGYTWYPNLVGIDPVYGYIMSDMIISDVVLTRGWEEPAVQAVRANAPVNARLQAAHEVSSFGYKQMTRFKKQIEATRIQGKVTTGAMAHEKMEKLSEKLFNSNN